VVTRPTNLFTICTVLGAADSMSLVHSRLHSKLRTKLCKARQFVTVVQRHSMSSKFVLIKSQWLPISLPL